MVKVAAPSHVQFAQSLNDVPVGYGLQSADALQEELMGYCDILLGRAEAPVHSPYLDMCEIATAFYARALEIEMMIYAAERHGDVIKGTDLYRFRTGALSSFIDLSKKMAELGSRRLTQEQLLAQQRLDAG